MMTEILILCIGLGLLLYFRPKRPHRFPPGPEGVPWLGYAPYVRTPVHEWLAELTKTYKKICGFYLLNIPVVVLNDWQLVKDAFWDERFNGRPTLNIVEKIGGKGLTISKGKAWEEQRLFSVKRFRNLGIGREGMEESIKDEVVELINEFKKQLNRPVSLEATVNMALLNSSWLTLAGTRFEYDDSKVRDLLTNIFEGFDKQGSGLQTIFLPMLEKLHGNKFFGIKPFSDAMNRVSEFIKEAIDSHRKSLNINNPKDYIDAYLKEIDKTSDPNSSFWKTEGEERLLGTLKDFYLAGIGATAITINWVFLYLITNPDVQEKVHNEIDKVLETGQLPTLADRARMPYLEAIIAETTRKVSTVPLAIHSTTEAMEFHGYHLPKDTLVIANLWGFHNDKDYWGDPENFRPERFIDNDGHFVKDDGLNPFSLGHDNEEEKNKLSQGRRVCIGESMSRDQTFLFLAGILQQFRFEMDTKSTISTDQMVSVLIRAKPYNVVIRDRNPANIK